MKVPSFRLLALLMAAVPAATSWGQSGSFLLNAECFINVAGRLPNTTLADIVVPIFETQNEEDDFRVLVLLAGGGSVGMGSGGVETSASAIAGTIDENEISPPSIGASVRGTATLTRSAIDPVTGLPGESGDIDVTARAAAKMKETLTIHTPNAPEPLRISGYLNLKGAQFANAEAVGRDMGALASAMVVVRGNVFATESAQILSSDFLDFAQILKPIFYSYEVFSDVPKTLEMELVVAGNVSLGHRNFISDRGVQLGTGEFSSTFSHTLSWGGITSVTNASTGEPITNWTVTSASGFDYSHSFPMVPEPSSLALALSVSMARMLRRRRH